MESAYLSPQKIADMTGLSKETVLKWCRTGRLKASRPGGKYLIKCEDFEAFMAESGNRARKEA